MAAVKRACRKSNAEAAPRHCFGAHLSIAGGMHRAIRAALQMRLDTVQVFVKNQRQWKATPLRPEDLRRWHELRTTPGFGPPIAHATYLINLATADRALHTRSREALAEELQRCQTLAIPYLVVHPGAAGPQPRERAITRVAAALDRIFQDHPHLTTMPLLETTAGQGTALGVRFEELGQIIRSVRRPDHVGVCIDTCHVFAAGYDLRRPDQYEAMIAAAQREVGLKRIRCWHLNDSRAACGAHRDRHAHIGRGQIGSRGFCHILSDPRFVGIPMILETPKGTNERGRDWDRVNVQRLRTIAARAAPWPTRRRSRR